MPGILEGKKILVTGVLTPASIAFAIADTAQQEGADIVLTSFGRVMSLTEKSARRMHPSLPRRSSSAGVASTGSSTRSRSLLPTRLAAIS